MKEALVNILRNSKLEDRGAAFVQIKEHIK